jgi:hypothetical protein
MRQNYTPIFASVLASRLWALPPATRAVWLWFQLRCDPEGYLCTDLAGVAIGANVTGAEAREALDVLTLPDADADPCDPNEGRLLDKVPRGWRVVGFEDSRDMAKREARNARSRRWMAKTRADAKVANDNMPTPKAVVVDVDASVDPTKPKTKTKTKTKTIPSEDGGEIPPTPQGRSVALDKFPESWQPSAALRAEATIAGIADLDARILSLRTGPIGGIRGVLPDQLDNYVRSFFGTWRTWDETTRAKAAAAAKPRAGGRPMPGDDLTTTDAATVFRPTPDHRAFCRKHSLDLDLAVSEYRKGTRPAKLGTLPAQEEFTHRLKCWATTGVFYPDGPMPKAPRTPKEAA